MQNSNTLKTDERFWGLEASHCHFFKGARIPRNAFLNTRSKLHTDSKNKAYAIPPGDSAVNPKNSGIRFATVIFWGRDHHHFLSLPASTPPGRAPHRFGRLSYALATILTWAPYPKMQNLLPAIATILHQRIKSLLRSDGRFSEDFLFWFPFLVPDWRGCPNSRGWEFGSLRDPGRLLLRVCLSLSLHGTPISSGDSSARQSTLRKNKKKPELRSPPCFFFFFLAFSLLFSPLPRGPILGQKDVSAPPFRAASTTGMVYFFGRSLPACPGSEGQGL